MNKCPKCGGKLIRDKNSIRCKDCFRHLCKVERQKFGLSRNKKKKLQNRKDYLHRKGSSNGCLSIREAAEYKGVTTKYLEQQLHRFHVRYSPVSIKFDAQFVVTNLRSKKVLR